MRIVIRAAGSGLAFVACLLPAETSGRQEQKAEAEKSAGQSFKNIQVLKGLPQSQLLSTMFFMEASLNVGCDHCHIYGQFEKDDKFAKQTARKMMLMVRFLNNTQFAGTQVVSCNTCHRGQNRPSAPLTFAAIKTETKDSASKSAGQLPTAEQLFARHLEAAGGEAALRKIASRVMTGTRFSSEGWNSSIEVDQQAPNKYLSSFRIQTRFIQAYTGSAGWSQDDQGLHDTSPKELAEVKQDAEFYRDLMLKHMFPNSRTMRKEKVNGRDAYAVQAKSGEGAPKELYFDVGTGLLVRIAGFDSSAFGPVPYAVDYADYRKLDGTQVPFTISHLRPDFSTVDRFTVIKHNAPIPQDKFAKPGKPVNP